MFAELKLKVKVKVKLNTEAKLKLNTEAGSRPVAASAYHSK